MDLVVTPCESAPSGVVSAIVDVSTPFIIPQGNAQPNPTHYRPMSIDRDAQNGELSRLSHAHPLQSLTLIPQQLQFGVEKMIGSLTNEQVLMKMFVNRCTDARTGADIDALFAMPGCDIFLDTHIRDKHNNNMTCRSEHVRACKDYDQKKVENEFFKKLLRESLGIGKNSGIRMFIPCQTCPKPGGGETTFAVPPEEVYRVPSLNRENDKTPPVPLHQVERYSGRTMP